MDDRKKTAKHTALSTARRAILIACLALACPAPVRAEGWDENDDLDPKFVAEELRTYGRAGFLPGLDPPLAMDALDTWEMGDGSSLRYGLDFTMNRVDGFTIVGLQEIRNRGLIPSFRGYEAYGINSKEWSGALEVRLRPFGDPFSLGGRWFDETTAWPLPVQYIRPMENTLAALFLREDYYDYLRRRGRSAFAEWIPSPGRGLQVSLSKEEQESLERVRKRLGPFGGDKEFDQNPSVSEETWHVLRARGIWALGSLPGGPWEDADAHAVLAEVQAAGGDLGDERRFVRAWGEIRGRQKLSSAQFVSYRVSGGWTPEGEHPLMEDGRRDPSRLPVQWRFQAGGPGSLRGHDFQEFQGDRIFLATLEYGLEPSGHVRPVMFVDWGKAWNGCQEESGGIGGSGPLEVDGGLGILFGQGAMAGRLDVARNLRLERASARIVFRLGIPF